MNRPYVERLHIENYGCIKNATFALSPLHALIGPNDSGKSTVLRALRTLTLAAGPRPEDRHTPEWGRLSSAFHLGARTANLTLECSTSSNTWRLQTRGHNEVYEKTYVGADAGDTGNTRQLTDLRYGSQLVLNSSPLESALSGSQLLRLDPDALRESSGLIADGEPLRLRDEHGRGLPGIYDAIITRDVNAYVAISSKLSELFASVKTLSLKNTSSSEKALGVQLKDGTYVPAELMSEGLLYYLAFAALPHLEPTAMILVEEPENGLHPSRIREVMRVLREISRTTQIVLSTHSPLVINELQPDEVSVLTRGQEGTRVKLIKDTPSFAERSKVYDLGELWVSYANGEDEAPLLNGGPRP